MADNADNQDVQASGEDITPEDFDGDQPSPKADSSTDKNSEAEDKTEAKSEETEKPADAEKPEEPEGSEEKGEEGAEEDDKSETETDKPKSDAEARKSELNREIRDLVALRNELKSESKEKNSEVYQAKSEKELVEEGMEPAEAKVEALRQDMAIRDYNDQVAEARLTLESEADRVLRDFSWANPENDGFDKELAAQAATLLQGAIITDPNTGLEVGSNISPYQLYQTLDKARVATAAKSQIEGQKATEKMMANADAGAATSPSKKAANPLDKLWADPL